MAVGKTGYVDVKVTGSGVSVGKIRAYWQEDYYVEENYSTITITNIKGYVSHRIGTASAKIKFTIDGATPSAFATKTWTFYANADGTLRDVNDFSKRVSDRIYHDDDGTKTISFRCILADLTISSADFDADNNNSATKSITLTNIPRASTIAATDANIESVSQITINRRSTAYNHTIKFSFGDLVGYIDAGGNIVDSPVAMETTNIAFAIPSRFYEEIPNNQNGMCTLAITTYSIESGNQIGDEKTSTFIVTADRSRCAPLLSGSIRDINNITTAFTDVDTKMIRYKSNAEVTMTAESRNSATIVSKSINGVSIDIYDDNYVIEGIESDKIVLSVTDSRDYTTSITLGPDDFTLIPYTNLSCNVEVSRNDPTSGNATLYLTGNYYAGSFGTVNNSLTLKYRIGSSGSDVTIQHNGSTAVVYIYDDNTYEATVLVTGLNYESTHDIIVTASDRLSTVTSVDTVNKGIPNFDMGENDVHFHVDVIIDGAVSIGDAEKARDNLGLGSVAIEDILPIEKGGTGTTDIEALKILLGITSDAGTTVKLMWENASPDSTFAAQTISLDLADWDWVVIATKASTSGSLVKKTFIKVGKADQLQMFANAGASSSTMIYTRRADITATGIEFAASYSKTMSGTSASSSSSYVIPLRIYAIKGVIM